MAKKLGPTTDVEKAIASGTFKDRYLVYIRKSTDEPDNQKNSIAYQRRENLRYAKQLGLPIAAVSLEGFCSEGVISEKHSGFKESDDLHILDSGEVRFHIERPKFSRVVQYLNQEHFKGVICLCWDRISRNRGDDTIVRKLMRKGADFQFVFVTYDDSSSGELHMDIDGMFAQHHSRVTSEKIKTTIRAKRAEGKCTYRAPIGYLNEGSWDHKPFDPERAPIIAELFELYATGHWSLSDLARHAAKQGLTTVPMRKPRTQAEMLADDQDCDLHPKVSRPVNVNRINEILANPFYTGKVIGPDGKHVLSTSHEPLVSQDVFDKVQTHLKHRKVSTRYTEKLDHPLRGFIRCADCNRAYTPYTKKGHLYYNARCVPGCSNDLRNCSLDIVSTRIAALLQGLGFTKKELQQLDAKTNAEFATLAETSEKEAARRERITKRIHEDLDYLSANQLSLLRSGTYTPETFVEAREGLEAELAALGSQRHATEAEMRSLMKDIILLSELVNTAGNLFILADPREQERIAKTVFSELRMSQNTLNYSLQMGLEPFENRVLAFSAPTRWLSELFEHRERIVICSNALSRLSNT